MSKLRFRFNHGPRYRVSFLCDPKSRTQQQFREECDINVIMRRYEETGALPMFNQSPGQYGEMPDFDYHTAMLQIAEARSAFMELPASMRLRFENDPGKLLEFLRDERNREEAESLGLINRQPQPAPPVKVEVIPPKVEVIPPSEPKAS